MVAQDMDKWAADIAVEANVAAATLQSMTPALSTPLPGDCALAMTSLIPP